MQTWLFYKTTAASEKYNSGFLGQVNFVSKLPLFDFHLLQHDQHAELKACTLPRYV